MTIPKVPLGEFVEIKGGGTPSKSNAAFWGGDIPWVSPKDMKTWEICDSEDKITAAAVRESATNLIPPNATLIVNRSGILKHTLPVGITRRPVAINQDIKAILVSPRAHPEYVAHIIKAAEPIVLKWVRATTADNFPIDNLRELEVPLPPLDEQRRIAAILDKADALRRKRKQAIELFRRLSHAIFRSTLDSFLWPTQGLGELCTLVRGSSPRPQGDPRFFGGPVPRLMIADITRDGKFVRPSIDSLTDEGALKSRAMAKGDVVMAVSGAVGLPAILATDACIHDGFVGFRNLKPSIASEFLYHALLDSRSENRAQGTGAIWSNLTTDQVKEFRIPLPPISIQRQLVDRLKYVEVKLELAVQGLASIELLFSSLQHRAFSGQL